MVRKKTKKKRGKEKMEELEIVKAAVEYFFDKWVRANDRLEDDPYNEPLQELESMAWDKFNEIDRIERKLVRESK